MTYTFAVLTISATAYEEIEAKLRGVGYEQAFIRDPGDNSVLIDMHGVALGKEPMEIVNPNFPLIQGKNRRTRP